VKLSMCSIKHRVMKRYEGVKVQFHAFLTSALYGGELFVSRPGYFTPRERAPVTQGRGGCVGPRVGLDAVVKRKPHSSAGNLTHGLVTIRTELPRRNYFEMYQ
jgi:hypothetical protein